MIGGVGLLMPASVQTGPLVTVAQHGETVVQPWQSVNVAQYVPAPLAVNVQLAPPANGAPFLVHVQVYGPQVSPVATSVAFRSQV